MNVQSWTIKFLSVALVATMCVTPELGAQSTQQNPPANPQQPAQGQQPQPPSGTTVNPSQPPLQPVAPSPGVQQPQPQQPQTTTIPEAPQPKQQPEQPVGAAAAEKVPTAGGAAAKPAGAAIAPAKQHQTRSLLIKLGAVAAGAVAIGTVYALSKASPSKPPGAP
ncbi:MAG TPA: hypothetical protein VF532_05540 [Candidatus Angelobacter sp.]